MGCVRTDEGHGADYLDLTRLDNADGTGYLPGLLALEDSIFAETEDFLAGRPKAEELAEFQEMMADRVLAHLQSIVVPGADPPPTPLERNGGLPAHLVRRTQQLCRTIGGSQSDR